MSVYITTDRNGNHHVSVPPEAFARLRRSTRLTWTDDRWHVNGRGIHAGDFLELLGLDGTWILVRIESADCGRRLTAFVDVGGHTFTRRIDTANDALRWPARGAS